MEVVVEGLHALVLEQFPRPAVGDAQPIRKEELVVVEHQPKNQNEDERAQVEELLDGVDEQQDGNAQKQTDTALNLLQDVHHEVGDHHRDGQRPKQVEGHVGQDFTSGSGLLVAQEQVKGHDAEDVRKRALVDHEFPRGGRQPSDAGDDDGAAHDGQRDGVHHGVQPRHGNGVVKEGGDGAGAQSQCGQRECRAAQDEGEFVASELEFQRGFEHDENQPDGAQQLEDKPLKGNVVEAHRVQSLSDGDAHGDEHQHAGNVGPAGEKVGEVRQDDHRTSADHQAVGVDVFCGQFEARIQDGKQGHACKITQIRQ